MRDQLALHPFGSISIRSFLLFVTTLVVTVFAFLFTFTQPVNAAGEATWKDGAITYENDTYKRRDDIKADVLNLPEGSKIYAYVDSAKTGAGPDGAIQIIYFGKDDDPLKAQKANFVIFDYKDPDGFANPTGKKAITVTPATTAEQAEETVSCAIEGVGWVVCPLTNFLSEAMDKLFVVMSEFLTVRPVQTDQESALYRAWSMMRNIANVAFVMAFLVVIYSQLSNLGLSNYGLKRMLPRLIVAAILVNVSYWICAVAVDLSNIFGFSLYDILMNMKDNLVGAEGNGWEKMTWHDLGAFILAGGTATAAAAIGVYSFTAGAGAGIFMLLPILLGVLISALVALLVMAARQAIITILIIVAPLAFVAYLLPNTEKYFKKWSDLFSTMLLLFPMFAVVVGGSQLAGDAIIQNAGSSINLIILGMAVKIAPVVITPFLLKFSGSLLGKIAGIVNNPGKGLLDRTRNFAQERRDALASKQLANTKNPNFLARGAQRIDANKRKRDGWKKANDTRRDATWANSQAYSDIHGYDSNSSRIKDLGENSANNHYAGLLQNDKVVQGLDIRARASKVSLDISQAKVEANWVAAQAKGEHVDLVANTAGSPQNVLDAIRQSPDSARDLALAGMRKQAAERIQKQYLSNQLQDNTATVDGQTLQEFAGGIDTDGQHGAQRALAQALKDKHSIRSEAVVNAASIIDDSNVSEFEMKELALGRTVAGKVTLMTDEIQEAAIKAVAGGKNIDAMQKMFDEIDIHSLTENQRVSLAVELKNNGSKPKYLTAGAAGGISQDTQVLGVDGVNKLVKTAIEGGKYSADTIATQDKDALWRVLSAIKTERPNQADLDVLKAEIDEAMTNTNIEPKLGNERKRALREILAEI